MARRAPWPAACRVVGGGQMKRLFDLVVAVAGLVVLAPVLLLVAVVVNVDTPGPVLYRSTRLGRDGTPFGAWKFRTMHHDADRRLARLLAADPHLDRTYATYRKLTNDPRVTSVGRFLRRFSIDELPQLVNVVRGDMSLVGPRPKLVDERRYYGETLATVLTVRPGLTGLWQVSGRNRLTMEERVVLDARYVAERSLVGDLAICLRTAVQMWRPGRHGAV